MKISDSIEATLASLDGLNAARRSRDAATFAKLEAIVANLDTIPPQIEDDEPMVPERRARRAEPPGRPADDSVPFGVSLPERTTHGGPFGPAVRRQLLAEARQKVDW
jgi:hypothetical protein